MGTTETAATLDFKVAQTYRPCDVHPQSDDERSLGVALCRIELTPRTWYARLWPHRFLRQLRRLHRVHHD